MTSMTDRSCRANFYRYFCYLQMRLNLCLCLLMFSWSMAAQASPPDELEGPEFVMPETRSLRIDGAADYPEIRPILFAFEKRYPNIQVTFTEFGTRRLYHNFLENKRQRADLILSSAMDLQIKLVNDGYAQKHLSEQTQALPEWAKWRDEVFGYSYEPATIAINRKFFAGSPIPKNRADLLEFIRKRNPEILGRVATFDIRTVGVGYLLWAYDSLQTGSYGRLLESFGAHDVRLFPSSAKMLAALASGEIAVVYNVLGSYGNSWAKAHPNIQIVLPNDYTTVLMRSAFIPKEAKNPSDAKRFLDFLLSEEGQNVLARSSSFYPIREDLEGNITAKSLRVSAHGPLRPIALGLPLMVLSDQMKRQILLEEWERALLEWE